MFINGVQQGAAVSDSNNYLNNAGRPIIGSQGYGAAFFNYNGYISNLRVLKGTGFTSVTVPTAPLTAIANTQLLMFQNNRFIENSSNAYTLTFAGSPQIRSFAPFVDTDTTTGSAYFDGTGDFLTIADNAAMELGAGDFCVECWIYPTSVTNTAIIIDKRSGTYGPLLIWRSTSTLQLYMSSNNSSWDLANGVTIGALIVNTWYHVAVTRSGTSVRGFVNGSQIGSTSTNSNTYNSGTLFYIGVTDTSNNAFNGYLDDVRITKGFARTITLPTSAAIAR
jgi:hypothetical protein